MKTMIKTLAVAATLTTAFVQNASAVQIFNWQMNCTQRHIQIDAGGVGDIGGCPVSGLVTGLISMPDSYVLGTTLSFNSGSVDKPVLTLFDPEFGGSVTFTPDIGFNVTLPVGGVGPASWALVKTTLPEASMVTAGATTTFNHDITPGVNYFAVQGTNLSISPIPEPGTWALLAAGLLGMGLYSRSRQQKDL